MTTHQLTECRDISIEKNITLYLVTDHIVWLIHSLKLGLLAEVLRTRLC